MEFNNRKEKGRGRKKGAWNKTTVGRPLISAIRRAIRVGMSNEEVGVIMLLALEGAISARRLGISGLLGRVKDLLRVLREVDLMSDS